MIRFNTFNFWYLTSHRTLDLRTYTTYRIVIPYSTLLFFLHVWASAFAVFFYPIHHVIFQSIPQPAKQTTNLGVAMSSLTAMTDINATSAKNIVKLAGLLPAHLHKPRVGIVCGSGLGTLAESIAERVMVPYNALEGFGESTGASLTISKDNAQMKE
jgi:hypothetical protein